jgi:ribosome-associated protein
MDDTARTSALEIARLIEEHRGEEVVVLYVGEMAGWTDYFLIATVRSSAHRKGLLRAINEYLDARHIEALNRRRHLDSEEGWILIDCGSLVIHLMDAERRLFYELEKLWFRSERIYSSSNSSKSSSSSIS